MHLEVPIDHARHRRGECRPILLRVSNAHTVRLDLHATDHSPSTTRVRVSVVATVEVQVIARVRRHIAGDGRESFSLEERTKAHGTAQKLGEGER